MIGCCCPTPWKEFHVRQPSPAVGTLKNCDRTGWWGKPSLPHWVPPRCGGAEITPAATKGVGPRDGPTGVGQPGKGPTRGSFTPTPMPPPEKLVKPGKIWRRNLRQNVIVGREGEQPGSFCAGFFSVNIENPPLVERNADTDSGIFEIICASTTHAKAFLSRTRVASR